MAERRRGYLFFGLAAVSLLMFSIDSTVVAVALPNMMSDLQLSPDKAAGMRTIFGVMAVLLLTTVPLTLAIPDSARARRRGLTPVILRPPNTSERQRPQDEFLTRSEAAAEGSRLNCANRDRGLC